MTAEALVEQLLAGYRSVADPGKAVAMAAYMKDKFAFAGVPKPARVALDKAILGSAPIDPDIALAVARECWRRDEREPQYAAVELVRKVGRRLPASALADVRTLIETRSWWDTVDALASNVVGPMVLTHSELANEMDRWIDDPDLWVARSAILHQLTYKDRTDPDRLFRYCLRQAAHRDFFIRKAIGWALRTYARTDPAAVWDFVDRHRDALSPLSIREATKHRDA